MTLMDRIKVKSFLTLPSLDKILKIESLQAMRINSLEEARTKKAKGMTKSATKNRAARGRKLPDPKAAAIAAMKKLNPTQLAKLKEIYS